jgi:TP901 family phage tail tape measure protein
MSTYEKIGIELDVKLSADIANAMKQLNDALGKFNPESMTKRLNELEKRIHGAFHIDDRVVKELVRVTGQAEGAIKKMIESTKLSGAVDKELKAMAKPWTELVKQQEAGVRAAKKGMQEYTKVIQEEARKQQQALKQAVDAGTASPWTPALGQRMRSQELKGKGSGWAAEIAEAKRQVAEAVKAREEGLRAQGSQWAAEINAIQKMTTAKTNALRAQGREWIAEINEIRKKEAAAAKQKLDDQLKLGSAQMGAYRNAGMEPFNNGYIRNSFVKDSNAAFEQAARYNNSLKQQADQILNLNGRQVKLNDAVQDYSNWLTDLNKQGKALWGNQIISQKEYNEHLGKTNAMFSKYSNGLLGLLGLEARFYGVRTVLFSVSTQIREAITSVLDLNQALHDTAAISGASVAEMKSLESTALQLAASSKFTATGIMEIMKTLAQAGVNATDMPEVTRATTLFATSAGATPDQAVKLMTTSLNAFGMEAENSMQVANALTAALNSSKLEAGGLGTSFNYLANQASVVGMSLEETLGIIAAMSQKGIMSSTIGTGMSQLITNLASPKAALRKLIAEKGLDPDKINPAKNSFADVLAELEKANLTYTEISKALETRVARALFTALNVGSDGFRRMTEAVTGTNAVLIANAKAMEGVRNQMNVVKQEFVIVANEMGKVLAGPLSFAFQRLRDFVAGLNTESGKTTLIFTGIGLAAAAGIPAIVSITKAIQTFGLATALVTKLNPWLAAITTGLTLAGAAVTYFGSKAREGKEELENYTKVMAKSADQIKRAEDGMNSFAVGLKAAGIKKAQYADLTLEQRNSLDQLIKNFPEYLGKLNKEKDILEQIAQAQDRVIEGKEIGARIGVSGYNNYTTLIQQKEKELANLDNETKEYYRKNNAGYISPAVTQAKRKQIEAELEEYRGKQQVHKDMAGTYLKIDPMTGVGTYDQPKYTRTKSKIPAGEYGEGAGNKEKPVDFDKVLKTQTNEINKQISEYTVKEWEQYIGLLKDEIKDLGGKDKAGYDTATGWLVEAYQQVAGMRRNQLVDDFWGKTANVIGAEYTPTGNGTMGSFKFIGDNAKVNQANFKVNQAKFDTLLSQKLGAFDKENQQVTNRDISSIAPIKHVPEQRSTLMKDEKMLNMQLATELKALNMRKEYAATGEDVAKIERDITAATLSNTQAKIHMYNMEVARLKPLAEAHGLESQQAKDLEMAQDGLRGLIDLQDELLNKQKEQSNTGFWHNYQMGMNQSIRGLGTYKSAVMDLGAGITDTLTNSINGMVTALTSGGNAWKNFKNAFAQTVGDIGKVIQKYIAKLAALWLMQKLTGIMTSNPWTNSQGINTPTFGQTNYSPVNVVPTQFRAEGGLITGGVAGRDSVPAMLSPGEYVVRASAVNAMGIDTMNAINQKRISKFAEGGLVGGGSGSGTSGNSGITLELTLNNITDVRQLAGLKTSKNEVANFISLLMDERHPVTTKMKMKLKE